MQLNGGHKFSDIDLSETCLQMEVRQMEMDEAAKKVLATATHRCSYQFNRMPFRIASAPVTFQRMMEQVIAGSSHVACYLDDIIVAGCDDDGNRQSLGTVFQRQH